MAVTGVHHHQAQVQTGEALQAVTPAAGRGPTAVVTGVVAVLTVAVRPIGEQVQTCKLPLPIRR